MIIGVIPINRSPDLTYRSYGVMDGIYLYNNSKENRRSNRTHLSYGTEIAIPTYNQPKPIIYENMYKLLSVRNTKEGPIYYEYTVFKNGKTCYPFKVKVIYDTEKHNTYARSFVLTNNMHEVHSTINEYPQYFKTPFRSLVEDMLSFYAISDDHKNDITNVFNKYGLYFENISENNRNWLRAIRDIVDLDNDRLGINDKYISHIVESRLLDCIPKTDSVMSGAFTKKLSLSELESLGDRCYGVDLTSAEPVKIDPYTTEIGSPGTNITNYFEECVYSDMIIEYILSNGVEVSGQETHLYTRYPFLHLDKEKSNWEINAICTLINNNIAETWDYYKTDGDIGKDNSLKIKIVKTINDEVYIEARNLNTNKVVMSQHIDLILDGLCSRGVVWPIGY